jgi:hypothetical protein
MAVILPNWTRDWAWAAAQVRMREREIRSLAAGLRSIVMIFLLRFEAYECEDAGVGCEEGTSET